MRFLIAALLTAVMLISSGTTRAAEIESAFSENCALLLRGTITAGDLDKLRTVLTSSGILKGANLITGTPDATLCLDSSGGAYPEAVQLARMIFEKGLATIIDDGMECLSACGLVFMAGRTHGFEVDNINRSLHIRGRLGFTAPDIEIPEDSTPDEVAQAYLSAVTTLLDVANAHSDLDPPHGSQPVLYSRCCPNLRMNRISSTPSTKLDDGVFSYLGTILRPLRRRQLLTHATISSRGGTTNSVARNTHGSIRSNAAAPPLTGTERKPW
jgi:hypothetical protein